MRKKPSKPVAVILAAAALTTGAACILVPAVRSASDGRLLAKPEDEIYAEACQWDTKQLIGRLNRLEKKYPAMEDQMQLLPLYTVLIDRAGDFSQEQLLELISEEKTRSGIDCAFVEMYARNEYDPDRMAALLNDKRLADRTKEYIVSHCGFSAEQLCELFRAYDTRVAVVAAKKLAVAAPEKLATLADECISSAGGAMPDEKARALCLAIAGYYEGLPGEEEADAAREKFAPILKQLYRQGRSDPARNEAVYALGRICDDELFAWIIDNDNIDMYLKLSVIERNYSRLKTLAESAASEEDLSLVLKAMEVLPIQEIGSALQDAVDSGRLPPSEELLSIIASIEANGIPAMDKY